jgi:hypothetical protein
LIGEAQMTKPSLSIIICECGFKILLVPDVNEMNQAIEKHVLEHKNKGADEAEVNRIEKDLVIQIFNKISDSK